MLDRSTVGGGRQMAQGDFQSLRARGRSKEPRHVGRWRSEVGSWWSVVGRRLTSGRLQDFRRRELHDVRTLGERVGQERRGNAGSFPRGEEKNEGTRAQTGDAKLPSEQQGFSRWSFHGRHCDPHRQVLGESRLGNRGSVGRIRGFRLAQTSLEAKEDGTRFISGIYPSY